MTGRRIYCFGEALIDIIPDGAEDAHRSAIGGSVYNVALALGRLEAAAGYIGRLSTDPNGKRLRAGLERNQISLAHCQSGDEASTLAYVFPPDPGSSDVRYTFYLEGTTEDAIDPSVLPSAAPEDAALMHMGCFSAIRERTALLILDMAQKFRDAGALVSYDPNIRPLFLPDKAEMRARVARCAALSDIVKISDADAAWLYGAEPFEATAQRFLEAGAELVIITKGGDGAEGFTRQWRCAAPGEKADLVDTVGAGDCFMAALLWRLQGLGALSREDLRNLNEADCIDALSVANKAGAIVVSRRGADSPTKAELEAAIASTAKEADIS